MGKSNEIVIIIPAYNPTQQLVTITNSLLKYNFKIVVVDDGTSEEKKSIFTELDESVVLLKHDKNMGKGRALKTAFNYVIENMNCIGVITVDADGQHLLKDVLNVSKEFKKNCKNVVLGSRLETSNMPLRSKFGNFLTRIVFKIASHTYIYDTQTGLRAIPSIYLNDLVTVEGERYEYEINMLLFFTKKKATIKEISISTVYENNNSTSSFRIIKDSFRIYKCLFKNSDIHIAFLYALSSFLAFIIDFTALMIFRNIMINNFNPHFALFVSVIMARIISSLFNFMFNRKVVFKSDKSFGKTLIQYYFLVLIVMAANYLFLDILTNVLGQNIAISKILVEIVLFISNYIIQKLHIFKKIEN